jgi:protein-S-isoprenylcysteine O-methyltransferase Ste14
VQDVANRGIVRPPLVYLGAMAAGFLLHAAWPVGLGVGAPFGALATLLAVALFAWAVRTLRVAGTPVPGDRPTTAVVRTGPFRYSRNPIYVAFSLFHFGLACWMDSAWLLLTLLPAVGLMSIVVIPREERYLAARFASEYLPYKSAVRRWL